MQAQKYGENPYSILLWVFFRFMGVLVFSEIQMVRSHSEFSENVPYLPRSCYKSSLQLNQYARSPLSQSLELSVSLLIPRQREHKRRP